MVGEDLTVGVWITCLLFNYERLAYSVQANIYWDLGTENGIKNLSTFMLNNKNYPIRFTLSGEFLVAVSPTSSSYYVNVYDVQFFAWILTAAYIDYLYVSNVYLDGELQNTEFTVKVNDILNDLMSIQDLTLAEAKFALAGIFLPAGIALIGAGYALMKVAFACTVKALAILGLFAGWIVLVAGLAFFIAAIVLGISGYLLVKNG